MGEVYRALDTRLQREVALKFLSANVVAEAERLLQFEQEARVLAALNHPNIVTIYSIEEWEEHRFLAMELIHGRTLREIIPEHGLPRDRFFELVVPVVDALQAAHERGITHRDLKPTNIMVSDEDRVKILDFGLATIHEPRGEIDSSDATTLTMRPGSHFSGTLPYMSPEQIQGKALDHRSDIFSLGTLLYEMCTGQRPFRGETPADVIASVLRDSPIPVSDIDRGLSPSLGRLIQRCLEKDIRRRVQSTLDLRNELEALQVHRDEAADTAPRSVAVLPFTDMSPQGDQGYFCDGIAEEIIGALGKLRELRVAARTSSFQFAATALDGREIGRRLGVDTLLEGSVRKSGERLRITAELINVDSGYNLWSERYDREMKDIFDIQDEIARSIAEALECRLMPDQSCVTAPTRDLQAYDYYLRGRQFYYQFKRRGIEFAEQMFSRAIELDPSYARAYAGIANCCSWLYMYGGSSEEQRLRANQASQKALELEPDLAEAHASRGVALSLNRQYEEAERAMEAALALNPRLFEAYYFYARIAFAHGKLERAVELYEKASQVRPDSYEALLLVAQIYDDLERPEDAARSRRRGTQLVEERIDLHPDDARALTMGANGLVALGERQRGLEWARRAQALEPQEPMVLYNVACIQSLAGEPEEALNSLESAVTAGLTQVDWVRHDSNLDPLREHPRFRAIMERLE
jgi:non-specific serine/threonine protein kinase